MRGFLIVISLLFNITVSAQVLTDFFQLGSLPVTPAQPTALPLPQGQQLYAVTACYRPGHVGSFIKVNPANTQPQPLAYLRYEDGAPPYGQLIAGSEGRCYGTAFWGGLKEVGTIFVCRTDGTGFSVLHHFNGLDGRNPQGKLVSDTDGKLYGTTREGGLNGFGTLFRMDNDGTGFTVLHHFTAGMGSPAEGLVRLPPGDLVGLCLIGGTQNLGGVWKLPALGGSTPEFLHDFTPDTGYGITPSLFLSTDGYLYCTTDSGGSFGRGSLFRLQTTNGDRDEIYSFPTSNGPRQPVGPVTEDASGQILGIAKLGPGGGSGVIFSVGKDGSGFQTLYTASSPYALKFATGLLAGDTETIYTTLTSGGVLSGGCYIKLPSGSSSATEIASFRNSSTDIRQANYLSRKPGGGWLGLSLDGGINDGGTFFEFGIPLADRKILFDFQELGCSNPSGPLLLAGDGKLYGLLQYGGPNGKGVLYRVKPDYSGYEVVYAFGAGNEWHPRGCLLEVSEGVLVGTCPADSPTRPGVIFKVDSTGNNYGVLKTFSTTEDGLSPALIYYSADNSNLIGVCTSGGTLGSGTVFQISSDGGSFVKLHDFQGSDGTGPNPSAYLAKSGILYGTTSFGGQNNAGTVFSIIPATGSVSLVSHMAPTDVSQPVGIQFEDQLGYLYGGAVLGGLANQGGIFRVKPDGANPGMVLTDRYGEYLDSIQNMILDDDSGLVFGARYFGFAEAGSLFSFKLQPRLQIQAGEVSMLLKWLDIDRPYTLEATGSLLNNWQPYDQLITTMSGTNSITIGTGSGALYFRLKRDNPNP